MLANPVERLTALEECDKLGQGFQLAERDMGIRRFGNIFGEQQTGDVGNVGIDLFFEMLFESLSKVEDHRLISVPYQTVHVSTQISDDLRRQYGKEPRSMDILLKNLYVRRMAADLGITRVFTSGKTAGMTTNMTKKVFNLMMESMTSDVHHNSHILEESHIKLGGLNSMLTTEHGLNIPAISKAPAMMLGMDVLHGSPARLMCLLFLRWSAQGNGHLFLDIELVA
ncbi:hypothetical protein GIB67_015764 [Kingdonia uniflora]|uniref:Uncharacterized protein n=1 Tax=Kingdonia uniflora TaxID=39325 RepID=A0A7J7NV02_9MAGN|nr:hypothetical protein GIB67_015764 [Kingdonia uniflora]